MAVVAKCLDEGRVLSTTLTTLYTSTAIYTKIDKLSIVNVTANAATFTVHLIASGGSATDANKVVSARSVGAGAADLCPEVVGQDLNPGGFIQVSASANTTLSSRLCGRQSSGS